MRLATRTRLEFLVIFQKILTTRSVDYSVFNIVIVDPIASRKLDRRGVSLNEHKSNLKLEVNEL